MSARRYFIMACLSRLCGCDLNFLPALPTTPLHRRQPCLRKQECLFQVPNPEASFWIGHPAAWGGRLVAATCVVTRMTFYLRCNRERHLNHAVCVKFYPFLHWKLLALCLRASLRNSFPFPLSSFPLFFSIPFFHRLLHLACV